MKKFLSLVLALIMTMSLVTIGAGATEYRDLTDKDEIQYEEAVAVLNRIGVITGYEDGSFRPETELTRGAAAKIIVSLLIGPEAASNLPNATAPYPDVPASHTFAGVISYCKTAGIISGYGDGTFKPANSLTGFAFAKMLLGALGYKSEIEGFVDTGWTMNVARVGNVTGLFDRLDFDGSAAVNRETACQLALNTLKATMVTYGGTTLVTGAQTLAVQGTQAMYVTSNNREINANINRRVISAANNEMTLEFGEEHFKDLRLEHDKYDPAYDVYGHPSNEWSWKKVTIGTFKLPADFTYTKQMSHLEDTAATKEKALGLRGYDTWSIDHRAAVGNWSSPSSLAGLNGASTWSSPFDDATQITINGWNARVADEKLGRLVSYDAGDFNGASKKPAGVPTISEIADLTDNGVTVEVYVCPVDADFITNVVVTRTQLMKVKRLGSDFVTLEDVTPDSRDPRKDSDLKKITGYNAFAIDVTEDYDSKGKGSYLADVKDSNYDAYNALKDMKAGDYVAVVPYTTDDGKTWEVGEAYAPETVSGAFTKVDTYANVNKPAGSAVAITVGGTSYPINEWNKDMLDVTGSKIKATKKDVTLYLAKDGTVLWADEIGNSDAWMVVGDYYQATGTNGKVGWYVHGWTIGGAEVDLDLGTIRGEAEKYAPGELVYYNIATGGDGEYQLSKPNNNAESLRWDNTKRTEVARTDSKGVKTGEGIYDVAQFTNDRATNKNVKTRLVSRDGAIALEKYGRDNNALTPYNTNTGNPTGDDGAPVKILNKSLAAVAHDFQYCNVPYNGVKFIFVTFDQTNGNVETIEVKSGAQNVEYEDLIRYNTKWRNVGTNVDSYVVSPAEAYVNDKGEVKAVVIKADSAEADLSRIAVITDTPGDKNKNAGAEGDRVSGMSYAKQYITGPNFSLSEEKTGYFDKDYPIGTILVISEKENVIVGKYFHTSYYNNGNPDTIYVTGIHSVKRGDGGVSKIGFTVGNDTSATAGGWKSTVTTLDGKALKENDNNNDVVPGTNKTVELLTNKYTVNYDTADTNMKGLVTVSGGTAFVDLRPVNTDTIDSLDDLLDYDLSTLKLRVLVNGSLSSDTFRRAYAVIVERADGKKDNVATPTVTIKANGVTENADTKKHEATVGSQVVLTAEVKGAVNATYQWYQVIGSAELPIAGATSPMYVVNPVILGDMTYRVKVTNTDNSKKDLKVITVPADYTVTGVTGTSAVVGSGKVIFKTGANKGAETISNASVKINEASGAATIYFRVNAPKFVSTATTISSLKFEVLVNGAAIANPITAAIPAQSKVTKLPAVGTREPNTEAANPVFGVTLSGADLNTVTPALVGVKSEDVTIQITELKYDNYDLKVVDGDKTYYAADLSSGPYQGTRGNAAAGCVKAVGETVAVRFDTSADVGEKKAAITGATFANAADATLTLNKAGGWAATTTGNVEPKGDGYVTVTVTTTKPLVEKYRITTAAGIAGALNTIQNDGAPVGGNNAITYAISPADGVTSSTQNVFIDITLATALTNANKAVRLNYQLKNAAGEVKDTFSVTFKNGYKTGGDDNDVKTARYTYNKGLTENLELSLVSGENLAGAKIDRISDVTVATAGAWAARDTFKVYFEKPVDMGVTGETMALAANSTMTFTAVIDPSGEFATVTVGGTANQTGTSAVTFTKMQDADGVAFDSTGVSLTFGAGTVAIA